MAAPDQSSQFQKLALHSYQTALCIIPSPELCNQVNRLRELHDPAFKKWPAHINVIYPFVSPDCLGEAVGRIQTKLGESSTDASFDIRVDEPGYFSQRHGCNIHISPTRGSNGVERLQSFQKTILNALGHDGGAREYNPHLTLGQTKPRDEPARDYLLAKAKLLPPTVWSVDKLYVLLREAFDTDAVSSKMKIWGTIELSAKESFKLTRPPSLSSTVWDVSDVSDSRTITANPDESASTQLPIRNPQSVNSGGTAALSSRDTYQFSTVTRTWEPVDMSSSIPEQEECPKSLKVSSYNVLVDAMYPPETERYAFLLEAILSESALADILILQEVSDEFLSYMLADETIRSHYRFATHGPPDQAGVGPLQSLRNIVVLSRWRFTWGWLPLDMRHKGFAILTMETLGEYENGNFVPLVLAGVHLSSGLTDSSVVLKKNQIRTLMDYLAENHSRNPQIIAGDFNLTTSSYTIEEAVKHKYISSQTAAMVPVLENMLSEDGLSDAWMVAHTEGGEFRPTGCQTSFEDLYDGEEGGTFDPTENRLASTTGATSNFRPQRYDRILFKGSDVFKVAGFNLFGFPTESHESGPVFASDHWGVRADFFFNAFPNKEQRQDDAVSLAPLELVSAPSILSDSSALETVLANTRIVPSQAEADRRREVFDLVKNILEGSTESADSDADIRSKIPVLATPVGSYALGLWSPSSDIDCLCVGSISTKTFFELAGQRLRKAGDSNVRILRKVKAASGTMMEIEVLGVKVDLQYCPAASVAERWSEVAQLPPTEPLFYLPMLSLTKLQPYRDLAYLQRTITHPATFRMLHRFIKEWAKQRGIYSSKFGYLGGIHITMLLSRFFKLLPQKGGLNPANILCTFFHHYATFDWKNQVVYDPFFYKKEPRYRRAIREPMVILSLHAPMINVARTTSAPSVRTITEELNRADKLLAEGSTTWADLVGIGSDGQQDSQSGARDFLKSYNSYIKINVQYWGLSLAKGSTLVGWLESRCLLLLVDLDRKLPDIHTRIWPARFTAVDSSIDSGNREYQGCYVIGLTKVDNHDDSKPPIKLDRKSAQDALQASLTRFREQILNDERYFDSSSAWIDVAHVKQADLGDLKLDEREWGNYVAEDDDGDSDDEDGRDESDLDLNEEDEEAAAAALSSSSSVKTTRRTAATPSKPKSTAKLRPASDVLNRLRWDPNLDSLDYVVGYEDRFLGVRETRLDKWKSDQTDEEFIPQHRIAYFKRKADGVLVWDRESRRDEIFGSGVSRGGA